MESKLNNLERVKAEMDGFECLSQIYQFAKTGYDTIQPDDFDRMRYYGLYLQKPKVGHFMFRVKVPAGVLTSDQLDCLASISKDFGRGICDITVRQNFQFHWLTIENCPEIFERLKVNGLTNVGACGDLLYNLTTCPLAGIDPDEIYDCRPLIYQIDKHFSENREYSNLPRKYKGTICGCTLHCSMPEFNDVAAVAIRRTNLNGTHETGFEFRVGGGLSTKPQFSKPMNMFVLPHQLQELFEAVTGVYRDNGGRENRKRARIKFLIEDWGMERFEDEVRSRLKFKPEPGEIFPSPRKNYRDHLGVHAQRQPGLNWIGVTILAGRMSNQQMSHLARIARTYGSGSLRNTLQQNILMTDVPDSLVDSALKDLESSGFQMSPHSIRRGAIACTGNEFCNLAITETKGRLKEIITYLEERIDINEPIRINLNGCPFACGLHLVGDIGLQGCLVKDPSGETVEGYDISLGGRLGGDSKFTRPIWRRVRADELHFALENLLNQYSLRREDDEDFADFTDRHSDEELETFLKMGGNASVFTA